MPERRTTPAELLGVLYEAAANPELWPRFLSQLARSLGTGTATLRVVDNDAPVVHKSYTVGFDADAGRSYEEQLVARDPFREPLSASPPGIVLCSHALIRDRDYERTAHYQLVFKPNGNFYAMGTHVQRSGPRALQIGVHRPRRMGPFQEHERCHLEFFSPHLRQAARIMELLGTFETALQQARAALDRLTFGVWLVGYDLRCKWMNAVAEDTLRKGEFGLGLRNNRLTVADASAAEALRAAVSAINAGSQAEFVRVGLSGASMVLVAEQAKPLAYGLGEEGGILVFLLDPDRCVAPDMGWLCKLYSLTPAEARLLGEFLRGLDLGAASARLGISLHTARSHIKSAMHKTGTTRQAELMRKLLLGANSLRKR